MRFTRTRHYLFHSSARTLKSSHHTDTSRNVPSSHRCSSPALFDRIALLSLSREQGSTPRQASFAFWKKDAEVGHGLTSTLLLKCAYSLWGIAKRGSGLFYLSMDQKGAAGIVNLSQRRRPLEAIALNSRLVPPATSKAIA